MLMVPWFDYRSWLFSTRLSLLIVVSPLLLPMFVEGSIWAENGMTTEKCCIKKTLLLIYYLFPVSYRRGNDKREHYMLMVALLVTFNGVIVNEAPQWHKGVIAMVPFVDVVTTTIDESIPLTTSEYDEWGNPNDEEYYHYIKSYSPYDNVRGSHPNMLVTTGLHDLSSVLEPAKGVAQLRQHKKDDTVLFLDTNMTAGHGGASGRFQGLKETAKKYAFLLALENTEN